MVSKSGNVFRTEFETYTRLIPEGVNLAGFQVDPDVAPFLYLLLTE